jgi:hypothetical protein
LREIPADEEFIILMNLIALMVVRGPQNRRIFSKPLEQMAKFSLQLMTQTEERWKSIIQRMKRSGYDVGSNITYNEFKKSLDKDGFSITLTREGQIYNSLKSLDLIIPLLIERKWSLLIAEDQKSNFICSDSPVALRWTIPVPAFWGPGFGMENTELTMPINNNLCLIGRFEGQSQKILVQQKYIAAINKITFLFAERFVYSANEDIYWLRKNGNVGNTLDLISSLERPNEKKNLL